MNSIEEYKLFLEPYISKDLAFCAWDPEGKTLAGMVPALEETVSRRAAWRALVLCGEEGLSRKNPYDLVTYRKPEKTYADEDLNGDLQFEEDDPEAEQLSELAMKRRDAGLRRYLEELQKAKFDAYAEAAGNPLTRLMTFLCEAPLVSEGINDLKREDPEYAEYLAESAKKAELREQIKNGETIGFTRPAEILCVAKRTCSGEEYEIKTSWTPHDDLFYSDFADRNMYFDRMRFFVFDILPHTHRNYTYDYIRYLYTVLLLAENDLPQGAVKPRRVYAIGCDDDEAALGGLLSRYNAKLDATVAQINETIRKINEKQPERLTDKEAEAIFSGYVSIPVSVDPDINSADLYANAKEYSLSEDCPRDEYAVWNGQLNRSRQTLKKLLKQPRRALKKAASDVRRLKQGECDKALALNSFQIEDLEESIAQEEVRLVQIRTVDLFDTETFDKEIETRDKAVRNKIDKRMTKKTTIAVGVVVLLVFLAGFLPMLFGNMAEKNSVLASLAVIGAALLLMAIVLFITLFFLRRGLRKLIFWFNAVMKHIENQINGAMAQFSAYLTTVCRIMRGFSVLKYRDRNESPDTIRIRILKKHIADIRTSQAETMEVLGRFESLDGVSDDEEVKGYDYDFTRPVDYPYPLPFRDVDVCRIEFLQPGCYAAAPVNLVKRITLKREELYD